MKASRRTLRTNYRGNESTPPPLSLPANAIAAMLAVGTLTAAVAAFGATGPVTNCSVGYLQNAVAPGTTIVAATGRGSDCDGAHRCAF